MENIQVMFSNKKNDWSTPQDFYDELNKEFNFTLDPCADKYNHKCDKYYTEEDNGLEKSWGNEIVFCNPPYNDCYNWAKKCFIESKTGATVVLLIPSRTDTKYFHEFIYNKAELRFIKGRLHFGNSKNAAPFPSMIAIYRGDKS